jgi:hypothetical protein
VINKRTVIGSFVVVALLVLQVGTVSAASGSQTATIDGTLQSITQSTDSTGHTTFEVTVLKADGSSQIVKLSAADAVSLGLVTANPDGTYIVNNVTGQLVSIPTSMVIVDPCSETENGIVAAAISAFFCHAGSTVLDNTVDALHAEGFGFGEIAQSCFMAEVLQTTCGDILNAKKSHDFSTLGLPQTVSNWGQLKKYAMGQEVKSLTNLGAIMSGRATPSASGQPTLGAPLGPGAAAGNGHGQGNGHGNGNGHGHKP